MPRKRLHVLPAGARERRLGPRRDQPIQACDLRNSGGGGYCPRPRALPPLHPRCAAWACRWNFVFVLPRHGCPFGRSLRARRSRSTSTSTRGTSHALRGCRDPARRARSPPVSPAATGATEHFRARRKGRASGARAPPKARCWRREACVVGVRARRRGRAPCAARWPRSGCCSAAAGWTRAHARPDMPHQPTAAGASAGSRLERAATTRECSRSRGRAFLLPARVAARAPAAELPAVHARAKLKHARRHDARRPTASRRGLAPRCCAAAARGRRARSIRRRRRGRREAGFAGIAIPLQD